jgi:NTP pyrophosphatase (non-canonical NTP hydrolase)
MSDSIRKITQEILEFRDERDWAQFHRPKELAVAICAEAGELLQYFVWQNEPQSEARVLGRRDEMGSEMADVAMLLFEMADVCRVDLAGAIRKKLSENALRYPVEKARGCNKKYNEL